MPKSLQQPRTRPSAATMVTGVTSSMKTTSLVYHVTNLHGHSSTAAELSTILLPTKVRLILEVLRYFLTSCECSTFFIGFSEFITNMPQHASPMLLVDTSRALTYHHVSSIWSLKASDAICRWNFTKTTCHTIRFSSLSVKARLHWSASASFTASAF